MTDDATTRALYETPGVAATYREARALPAVAVRTWVDTFRRALAGLDVRVAIDVGAGTGRFTAVLAAAVGGRVVGVEPIAEMVAVRETTAAAFVRGVAETLPLGTGTVAPADQEPRPAAPDAARSPRPDWRSIGGGRIGRRCSRRGVERF